jgi:uncharacterized membrane protein
MARDLHAKPSMMRSLRRRRAPRGCFHLARSVEIDAGVGRVFALWTRYEDFPRVMDSVRRTRRIDERCVLWDVDVAGHQLVWEARILESVPEKRIRWESRGGAPHAGEVCFEALPDGRTRLEVAIEYQPRSFLERLGARLGLPDAQVARELACFRRHVERLARDDGSAVPEGAVPRPSTGRRRHPARGRRHDACYAPRS